MKKTILIGMLTAISFAAFPQSGLKIKTAIPTNKGMVTNVEVKFNEFFLNKSLGSQFGVYTQSHDGSSIETFIVESTYRFQLSSIPTIAVMWDSVKNVLISKGLTVEDL